MTRRALAAAALGAALVAAIAASAWVGLQRSGGPTFARLDVAPDFRRLVSGPGNVSAGGAVLAGLDRGEAPAPPEPAELCRLLWSAPGVPARGPADATARVAVFSDANCPYCRRLDEIVAELAEDRPDLRLLHHEWPVLGASSRLAARATLAAGAQGGAEAMRRRLLGARFVITPAYLEAAAPGLGLDPARLLADMEAPQIGSALAATDRVARTLGFVGTPVVVVGATIAEGAVSRATLDRLLALEADRAPACP